ncbi:hypothetical protein EIN_229760 [Entamoeba invadens IP1]|uniref:Uncharacterized protein n=1 Tax=Entamoeba invadens IP1 TaxID=370355 RepID=A0A0A1U8Y2_ENTIV|nr:hypothetical protein EIN_229760 [Entamoeba invadens IP1]ELP88443.1 hypothetical protein EIN_229760 [Entamoeba invadens IP1]|eukprot:XP_004255214.1 hypothetical protein EIN_229760 [Entamoeba invadens IP1]
MPSVYSYLKSQEKIELSSTYIDLDHQKEEPDSVFSVFIGIVKQTKYSLITLFFCYFTSLFLLPRFINTVTREANCNNAMHYGKLEFISAQVCSLFCALGDFIGRLLEFIPKTPPTKVICWGSVVYTLLSVFVVLLVYFTTAGLAHDAVLITQYVMTSVGFFLGLFNGYLVACAIEHSLIDVEPRLAVAVVSLSLYFGVLIGNIFQIITATIDNAISSNYPVTKCPNPLFPFN